MARKSKGKTLALPVLLKATTGINGFDEITGGGLPRGRPALVCGSAGCGKTVFAMEFLVRGATQFDEPGVFIAFEESESELAKNVASLGFDLPALVAEGKLVMDHITIDRSQISVTGDYDLEGLFIRLNHAIDSIGAKRVVLDTLETLFGGLSDDAILRSELRRLFHWLKEKGVTAVITAESGKGMLTRQGLEEYVSDCVILLDHRVNEGQSTRRLRIVKYRGSSHGTNEYPFLIDQKGISVLPVTSLGLTHEASTERVSTGIPRLDEMLGGKGFYKGTSVLITGMAGTGKTSIAAQVCAHVCKLGQKALFFGFEESKAQLLRNMGSVGIDLATPERNGRFHYHAARPSLYGLEMHLAVIHRIIDEVQPDVVVIDPVSVFMSTGAATDVRAMVTRLIDHVKSRQMTALFTSKHDNGNVEDTDLDMSSLMDTWLLLRTFEIGGERNRGLFVLKSRGMPHSNQVREFTLSAKGIDLVDVYVGPEGVLTGSARRAFEAKERQGAIDRVLEAKDRQGQFFRRQKVLEAQIASLQAELETEQGDIEKRFAQDAVRLAQAVQERRDQQSTRTVGNAQPKASTKVAARRKA